MNPLSDVGGVAQCRKIPKTSCIQCYPMISHGCFGTCLRQICRDPARIQQGIHGRLWSFQCQISLLVRRKIMKDLQVQLAVAVACFKVGLPRLEIFGDSLAKHRNQQLEVTFTSRVNSVAKFHPRLLGRGVFTQQAAKFSTHWTIGKQHRDELYGYAHGVKKLMLDSPYLGVYIEIHIYIYI